MPYEIDLTSVERKSITSLSPAFSGQHPNGETLSFTNYYMEIDHQPFFGVSGELHYSRLWEDRWEDSLIKCKAGGISIISTYVFWIHHEEIEGEFDFGGRRDLRRFVQLCQKHDLRVIVRIGPFAHGEVRNGGLPDWLYGKPFEPRSLDEGFIECTRRWYERLGQELQGLFYQDGGPIIATQLDNEYMHSAAPWEITSGVSNEWLPVGEEGDAYLLKLLSIAQEAGIITPFYTCTGWGGAATPEELMPLWGGYAFRPWIFYSHQGEHPATEEYIYRDNHNDAVPTTYNFEPFYRPESKPYLCCEMGGGMTCCYYYRFILPFESVDAMANIKLASGCNMLGYYMYHGGTNPTGRRTTFLNEGQVPKLSYDYQAALGEYGQVRDSYRRLRALHLLTRTFEQSLCRMKTVLPKGSQVIDPHDADTLRYALRIDENGSGFLFINNYQDHAPINDKLDQTITLRLPTEVLVIEGINLSAGENCVLPFHLDIGGIMLRYALAQPLTIMNTGQETVAFFFIPEGMKGRFVFSEFTNIHCLSGCRRQNGSTVVLNDDVVMPHFSAEQQGEKVHFVILNRRDSLNFNLIEWADRQAVLLSEGVLLPEKDRLRLESMNEHERIAVFPNDAINLENTIPDGQYGLFKCYRLEREPVSVAAVVRQTGPTRYVIDVPQRHPAVKEQFLSICYHGDIAQAFINGQMAADNFSNGAPWEIALNELADRLEHHPLTVVITPLKQDANVNVESVMAGRKEEAAQISGGISRVTVSSLYEWQLATVTSD